MNKTKTIPLLSAVSLLVGLGFYVSATQPAVALQMTWDFPTVDECYVPAQGFIVQVETDGVLAVQDTTFFNWYDYVPPVGTHRFRVLGFSFMEDGSYSMGMMADEDCVALGDTAWSLWSDYITTIGTVGQAGNLRMAAGVK